MKKISISLSFLLLLACQAIAQLNEGGLPLSLTKNIETPYVRALSYDLPNWEATLEKEKEDVAKGYATPYITALFTPSDISFPESGTLTTLDDGTQIWIAKVTILNAKAIGAYYDKFALPKGVKYFISNANSNQVLGAYTSSNNSPTGLFANEAVQGDVLNLEIDISPSVLLSDIHFHINRLAVYFRGVDYLNYYRLTANLHPIGSHIDSLLNNLSSVCMINAVCPVGSNYQIQRQAALQELIPLPEGVGACSAAMVNSTGNSSSDCKKYLLTASHCTGGHYDTSSSDFAQTIFRFNYERATCADSFSVPTANSIVGAEFIARSNTGIDPYQMNGDFILLKITQPIPDSWNVKLAGWNNASNIPVSETAPRKFIGFHHPGGDVKKVSISQQIQPVSLGASNSHWVTSLTAGLVAEGSSGSVLFDGNGLVIGIASADASDNNMPFPCNLTVKGDTTAGTGNIVYYSKFSNDWNYAADGNNNYSKLKPWLDPINSGVTTIAPVTASCGNVVDSLGNGQGGTSGIKITGFDLANSISLYPNPTTSGEVQLRLNFKEKTDLTFKIIDVSGKTLKTYTLEKVASGGFTLDLSSLPNALYFIQISNGGTFVTKKTIVSR